MLAPRHRDIADLNHRARQKMRDAGRLEGPEIELGERSFSVGDEVLALRNDYRHDLLNGTRATVTAIDDRAQQIEAKTPVGRSIEIPFAYAADGNLTHGYATTIHKAQGATTDRALILADDSLAKEHLYTALSRGRTRNDLYLATNDLADELAHTPALRDDPAEALARSLSRVSAQELAIDGPVLER